LPVERIPLSTRFLEGVAIQNFTSIKR